VGDIFTLSLVGNGNWVFVSAPNDLKTYFTADTDVIRGGESGLKIFGPLVGNTPEMVLDGKPHHKRRVLMRAPFNGERMRAYTDVMREVAERAIDSWPVGSSFPVRPRTQKIALYIILRAIFGIGSSTVQDRDLQRLLTDLNNVAFRSPLMLLPWLRIDLGRFSPWGAIVKLIRDADQALYAEIRRRRAEHSHDSRQDVLSLLLDAKDEDGKPLTDQEIRDELVAQLLAGQESTGTMLAWSFQRILSSPEVYAKIEAELESVVGVEPLNETHVAKFEYLDATIKEVLRLSPVTPSAGPRLVKQEFKISSYVLTSGTIVASCPYLTGQRPDIYPEPKKFKPERFLGRKDNQCEFSVFGGGPKRCLGMAFALHEMKVVLATAFRSARFRAVHPEAKYGARGFFVVPEGDVPIVLTERKPRKTTSGRSVAAHPAT
jgi:cytochrome P450